MILMTSPLELMPFFFFFASQIIQTLSAVDRDEPENGHHFLFSLTAEAAGNLSFTLRDNGGKDEL